MQIKTTRAFRTISEAGEELDLQPHVLRFWESKFPQIKPMKRGGGRRFYRPEDIEFLRGIKILLHNEKHPIKDVQKLIRVKGAGRIIELGRSVERAALPKDIKDLELIPGRIINKHAVTDDERDVTTSISDSDETVAVPVASVAKVDVAPVLVSSSSEEVVETKSSREEFEYVETEVDIKDVRKDDVIIDETEVDSGPPSLPQMDTSSLQDALNRLASLRGQWADFKSGGGIK